MQKNEKARDVGPIYVIPYLQKENKFSNFCAGSIPSLLIVGVAGTLVNESCCRLDLFAGFSIDRITQLTDKIS